MAALRAVVAWCLVWLSLAELCFGQVPPFAPASSAAAPFVSRYYSQATTFYGRTILFGGIDGNGNILNDVWSSRDDGASWSFVPNTGLPARYSGALVTIQTVVNNTQLLLFVGGAGSTGASSNAVYFSVDGSHVRPNRQRQLLGPLVLRIHHRTAGTGPERQPDPQRTACTVHSRRQRRLGGSERRLLLVSSAAHSSSRQCTTPPQPATAALLSYWTLTVLL